MEKDYFLYKLNLELLKTCHWICNFVTVVLNKKKKNLSNYIRSILAKYERYVSDFTATVEDEWKKYTDTAIGWMITKATVQRTSSSTTRLFGKSKSYLEENIQLREQIQILTDELGKQERKSKDLMTRLSEEMSSKIASNDSFFENINIKNRPMNIKTEYQHFVTNIWHDAKCTCDDMITELPDDVSLRLLHNVIMHAEQKANAYLQSLAEQLVPVMAPGRNKESIESLQLKVQNIMLDTLKISADSIDVFEIFGIYAPRGECDDEKQAWETVSETPSIQEYVEVMYRIAWKMVLQRPKLQFKACIIGDGPDIVDLYYNGIDWSQANEQSRVVSIHPAMFQGKTLLCKGKMKILT